MATVLLVEDEAGVGALANRILREAGYRVTEAAHAHERHGLHEPSPRGVAPRRPDAAWRTLSVETAALMTALRQLEHGHAIAVPA